MAPEGSSGLTGWASWSSSRPAAAPGRSCWATAVLRSPLGLPREKGCWGHLGLGAVREPSHMPLEGSASCPVTFLQSRGPAHGLDCPALLPSSTQAPPHMTPSQPLCIRPWPWGRDAHLLGSVGVGIAGGQVPPGGAQGSRGDGLVRASPSQRLLQGWVETPFLERLFRARGCGMEPLPPAWAPPCSGEELPPAPAALLDSEPQVKQRDSCSPWSGSGLCSAAGGSRALRARGGQARPECGQGSLRGSEKANQSQPEGQNVRGSSPPSFPCHLGLRHISL